jgi:hypothetical protein
MKKFGFGKKSGESSKNAAPAASNPYAQQPPAPDPYAQDTNKYANMPAPSGGSPYQQARSNYGGLPGGPGAGRGGLPGAPAPSRGGAPPPNNRQNSGSSGYGNEKYGSGGGYGANRYDNAPPSYSSAPPSEAGSKYGPGGYGGMGRSQSSETASFNDKKDDPYGAPKDPYAQRSGGGYGEDRQLTAEEEEEEDVNATKQQIRFMKQEDVSSTRNALRVAAQAEETGRATLARLGAQGERIHNTEKNLDIAANHNRAAEAKAKELKTLNRSMFAVHVNNPFTGKSRREARDREIIEKHQSEREERDATRNAAYGSQQRMERTFKELQPGDPGYRPKNSKASLAERSKYQFEADSEDEEMENEIDSNLDALSGAAGRLNLLARATGEEVEAQNKLLDRVTDKVCFQFIYLNIHVLIFPKTNSDQIMMNRARLDRIK